MYLMVSCGNIQKNLSFCYHIDVKPRPCGVHIHTITWNNAPAWRRNKMRPPRNATRPGNVQRREWLWWGIKPRVSTKLILSTSEYFDGMWRPAHLGHSSGKYASKIARTTRNLRLAMLPSFYHQYYFYIVDDDRRWWRKWIYSVAQSNQHWLRRNIFTW